MPAPATSGACVCVWLTWCPVQSSTPSFIGSTTIATSKPQLQPVGRGIKGRAAVGWDSSIGVSPGDLIFRGMDMQTVMANIDTVSASDLGSCQVGVGIRYCDGGMVSSRGRAPKLDGSATPTNIRPRSNTFDSKNVFSESDSSAARSRTVEEDRAAQDCRKYVAVLVETSSRHKS